jgi:hypothetical protein
MTSKQPSQILYTAKIRAIKTKFSETIDVWIGTKPVIPNSFVWNRDGAIACCRRELTTKDFRKLNVKYCSSTVSKVNNTSKKKSLTPVNQDASFAPWCG